MSFLSSKPAVSQQPQELNSINVNRSRYGDPVPLLYGTDRVTAMLGWYGGFNAVAQTQASAGKGGGSSSITGYNYTASCVMLLFEGFAGGATIGTVWKDKAITTLAAEGLTLLNGAPGQAVWSYLSTNFASQAINYNLTTCVGGQNIDLGSSAALANYTFEGHGLLALPGIAVTFTAGLTAGATSATLSAPSVGVVANGLWDISFSSNETRTVTITGSAVTWDSAFPLTLAATSAAKINYGDADPSAIWLDYCQSPTHGANFFLTDPGIQGVGNTYQTYCKANWMQISVFEETQRSASSCLREILDITNSDCFMSAGVLKIVPYCDATITGNGVTYTPNLTPLFNFTDDDYLPASQGAGSGSASNDPVSCIRKPTTQTFNCVRVEYLDRSDNYNVHVAEWKDPLDIKVNGLRAMAIKTFHQIKLTSLAQQVATLIGQKQLYNRRTFQFAVRADLYTLLEPMDLITVTDTLIVGGLETRLGLVSQLCRITQTDDDEHDVFTITCEEMLVGTASAPRYNITGAQGFFANYAAVPPSIAAPVVFLAPAALVGPNGGFELWCAIGAGAGGSYGGCNVYGSLDDLTWSFLGTVTGQARFGTVTTSHAISASTSGAADTFFLTMNGPTDSAGYQLNSASASDFAANRSLIWVDGEVVAFQTVTLLGTALYSVTVTRGLFGTTAAAHAVGASWCRLDPAMFNFAIDPGMVGQTMHLKGYSFNLFGQQTQALATDYATVIGTPPGQFIGAQLQLVANGVTISGNNVFKSASTSAWDSDVYSQQSYINGTFVSFQPAQAGLALMIGLNTDPTTDSSYASLDYAMYCTAAATLQVYNNGTLAFTGGSYAAGDILTVAYDGAFVRYSQNGAVIFQQPAPPNLQLFLDSSFFDPQASVMNLQFGPYGTATPVLWVPRGFMNVSDEAFTKTAGTGNAFDTDAYSINGYPTCHIVAKANAAGMEEGIALVPSVAMLPALPGFAGYTHYLFFAPGNTINIINAGTLISSGTPWLPTDMFSIAYNGTTVTYAKNGTTIITATDAGKTMYGVVQITNAGNGLNSVEFGPGAVIPLIDTPQVGLNAASQMLSLYDAVGISGVPATPAAPVVNAIAETVSITSTGSPIAVDVSIGEALVFLFTGTTGWTGSLTVFRDGANTGACPVATYDGAKLSWVANDYAHTDPVAFTFVDGGVPAGSHSYTLVYSATNAGSGSSSTRWLLGQVSMKLREIKR